MLQFVIIFATVTGHSTVQKSSEEHLQKFSTVMMPLKKKVLTDISNTTNQN